MEDLNLYQILEGTTPRRTDLSKEDIPEVERVIQIVTAIADRYWNRKVDAALDYVIRIMRSYDRATSEPPQGVRLAEELDRLMAAFEDRLACPLAPAEAEAVEEGARKLLLDAALALALATDLSPSVIVAAQRELRLILGAKAKQERETLRALVSQALTQQPVRASLSPPMTPAGAEWRRGAREALGGRWVSWGPAAVDAWAYRWHNLGRLIAGEASGVRGWVAQNPRDEKTTPFCWWVHGKVVSISRARAQLRTHLQAIVDGDEEALRENWPLLEPRGAFQGAFLGRGLPPYHFRCRTVVVPR